MKGHVNLRGCNVEQGGLIEIEWELLPKSTIKALVAPREGLNENKAYKFINRLLNKGRREIPTKKSISVKFRNDKSFEIKKVGRGPTIFKRIL